MAFGGSDLFILLFFSVILTGNNLTFLFRKKKNLVVNRRLKL